MTIGRFGRISAALVFWAFIMGPALSFEDLRLETWVKNLKNENYLLRKSAAKHLASLADKRAIPYLIEALADKEAEVRSEVCNALGLMGDEEIKIRLQKVMYTDTSPMVRGSAKRAIDKIDGYLRLQEEKKLKEMKGMITPTPEATQ